MPRLFAWIGRDFAKAEVGDDVVDLLGLAEDVASSLGPGGLEISGRPLERPIEDVRPPDGVGFGCCGFEDDSLGWLAGQ